MHTLHINFESHANGVAIGKAIAAEGRNVQAEATISGPDKGCWKVSSEWRIHLMRIKLALGHSGGSLFPCVIFCR